MRFGSTGAHHPGLVVSLDKISLGVKKSIFTADEVGLRGGAGRCLQRA
jgi:hypothetical protein